MNDHDDISTIIEAVREWQEAYERYTDLVEQGLFEIAETSRDSVNASSAKLRALRLPPVEEARRD